MTMIIDNKHPDIGSSHLATQVLNLASFHIRRVDYIQEITKLFLQFSKCDSIEIWIKKDNNFQFIEIAHISKDSFEFDVKPFFYEGKNNAAHIGNKKTALGLLSKQIFMGNNDPASPLFTKNGSFWSGETTKSINLAIKSEDQIHDIKLDLTGSCKSLLLIPLVFGKSNIGLIKLKSERYNFFTKVELELFEHIGLILASTLMNKRIREELSERIKELTCLYEIAKIMVQINRPIDEIFHDILKLLPPAWQYPEITCGKIIFDSHSYSTRDIQSCADKQVANLVVAGKKRGSIEVIYLKEMPKLDEGPFLNEERSLINTIAENIGLIIERKEAAEERNKLQLQLRHADRLATIGQLTAGVAHEINEPLGNILGLAQLAAKFKELPKQVKQDLQRIIAISMDAREIIKHLMIFARQKKPKKTNVNLNTVVNDGLKFFESRCMKEGIELVRKLSSNVPEIIADKTQIHQVLVNLITNALQAMPLGGKLLIKTEADENHVSLIVEDTGTGISDDVKKQMFIPFFTTKEVGQGTGIGLSVVHGVITSHNGTIKVESEIGEGTRFEVQLPHR
ncbi:MAG: GHKL domain-containing protein [Bacteroidales bacterium]|nr:GHKL domain-containing protein [Bacteroidales bacterium]